MGMSGPEQHSVVEYFGESDGGDCGYCKGQQGDSRLTHGMWAHVMSIEVYQALIDIGWRRSGCYCYKPTMDKTCCPQYTIKCDVTQNVLTRGQRKTLKKFHNYIQNGIDVSKMSPGAVSNSTKSETSHTPKKVQKTEHVQESPTVKDKSNKKRYQRYQRRVDKLKSKGLSDSEIEEHFECVKNKKLKKQTPKSIDYYFNFDETAKHKFEVRLVQSADREEFAKYEEAEFEVYKKYQMAIHNDTKRELKVKQFQSFLVNSPLKYAPIRPGSSRMGGSFHQQYWLDDKLIAVGVIDILDQCVSGVYLFYDPEYNFLSLGRLSALHEIMFTQSIHKLHNDFKYYYMGFYIHTCPKMRYKADYSQSYLLCPETYTWHEVQKAVPKLDTNKYARFAEPEEEKSGVGTLKDVYVLYMRTAMPFTKYLKLQTDSDRKKKEMKDVLEFCQLVPSKALNYDMFLYRS